MDGPPAHGGERSRPCALCASPATMLCARCLSVTFCNATCQRGAWRDHKPLCVPAATAATAMVLAQPKKAPSPSELPSPSMDIGRIVTLMAAYPQNVLVFERGLSILLQASADAAKCAALVSGGVSTSLVSAVLAHLSSVSLCETALEALANMSSTRFAAGAFVSDGMFVSLVTVLRVHAAYAPLCALASEIMGSAAIHFPEEIIAAGAAAPLVAALAAHAADARTSLQVAHALDVIVSHPSCKAAVFAAHAMVPLVRVLRTHAASDPICHAVCTAIGKLANDSPDRAAAAFSAGALVPVIAALRAHKSRADTCSAVCGAVASIVISGPASAVADALAFKVAAPLVAALCTHVSSTSVVQNAFFASGYLSSAQGNSECVAAAILASSRGLAALFAALRFHTGNEHICAAACKLLAAVAARDPACLEAASALGPLVAALRTHVSVQQICRRAIRAIQFFTDNSVHGCSQALLSCGAIPLLVSALRAHGIDPRIVQHASATIEALASSSKAGQAAAISAGAPQLLSAALARHGIDQCISAHKALKALGYTDEGLPCDGLECEGGAGDVAEEKVKNEE